MIFISLLIQYICRLIVITQEELKKQGVIRCTLISFYYINCCYSKKGFYFNPSVIPNKMGDSLYKAKQLDYDNVILGGFYYGN